MSAPTIDIDELIDRQKLSGTVGWVLFWAAAAMIADGYDLLSISYVAPYAIKEWGISKASFGPVFSAANAASMIGGAAFGFMADRAGRKKMLVFGTLLLGFSTLGASLATNLHQLMAWRLIAGFGLGAVPPIAIVMVNEIAPKRMRATIVAGVYLGNAIGVLLAALVAASFAAQHGWRIIFLIGGIAPLLVSIGLALFLPESLRFLVVRRPGSPQTARIAARVAQSESFTPDTVFVMRGEPPARGMSVALLFADGRWSVTLIFWLAYFASGTTLYTMSSWSPIILQSLGISVAHAALIASLNSIAGWCGAMVITRCMDKYGLRAMAVPPLLGFPIIAGLGYLAGMPELSIIAVTLLVGATYSGGHSGLHATGGLIYPTAIRGNGVALGLLVTRFAGVVAPIVAGLLFASNGDAHQVLWFAAAPLLVVSGCYMALGRMSRGRNLAAGQPTVATEPAFNSRSSS
jgi:MFS transporter, AAHS family, 4-hydroxybenzoate transporter